MKSISNIFNLYVYCSPMLSAVLIFLMLRSWYRTTEDFKISTISKQLKYFGGYSSEINRVLSAYTHFTQYKYFENTVDELKYNFYYSRLCTNKDAEYILDKTRSSEEIFKYKTQSRIKDFIMNITRLRGVGLMEGSISIFGHYNILQAILCLIEDFAVVSIFYKDKEDLKYRGGYESTDDLSHLSGDYMEIKSFFIDLCRLKHNCSEKGGEDFFSRLQYRKTVYSRDGIRFGALDVEVIGCIKGDASIKRCEFSLYAPYDVLHFSLYKEQNCIVLDIRITEQVVRGYIILLLNDLFFQISRRARCAFKIYLNEELLGTQYGNFSYREYKDPLTESDPYVFKE